MSERWVAPTNIELEKGGAGEGGAVKLWKRRTDGGLRFGRKVEPLRCDLCVGEQQSAVCVLEEGEGRACKGFSDFANVKNHGSFRGFDFIYIYRMLLCDHLII